MLFFFIKCKQFKHNMLKKSALLNSKNIISLFDILCTLQRLTYTCTGKPHEYRITWGFVKLKCDFLNNLT